MGPGPVGHGCQFESGEPLQFSSASFRCRGFFVFHRITGGLIRFLIDLLYKKPLIPLQDQRLFHVLNYL